MDRAQKKPSPISLSNRGEEAENISLEAMELEFALGALDVLSEGFDTALTKAAERINGKVLFNMPALDTEHAQRIGAITIAGPTQDQVIFVSLGKDGTSLSVALPDGGNRPFISLGHTYAAVMRELTPKSADPA